MTVSVIVVQVYFSHSEMWQQYNLLEMYAKLWAYQTAFHFLWPVSTES